MELEFNVKSTQLSKTAGAIELAGSIDGHKIVKCENNAVVQLMI